MLRGLTDVEMARVLGIVPSTFYQWRLEHKEFAETLRRAKDVGVNEQDDNSHASYAKVRVLPQQLWQLSNIHRNAPSFIEGQNPQRAMMPPITPRLKESVPAISAEMPYTRTNRSSFTSAPL